MMNDKIDVKMSEVLFFQEGPGVRNTQYTTSGVKLLNVANLVNGKVDLSTSDRYISEDEAYGKYSHFLCDDGDLIVASSGIKVDYIDKKMGFITQNMLPLCMNTSTIRFKALDDSRLNIRYFMYFLKSNAFKRQLAKQITGSAQLNYGPSHLKQMTLPLISIAKQNILVRKLDYLTQIIDTKNESIRRYDDLIKARFVEMFGNVVTNDRNWPTEPISKAAPSCSPKINIRDTVWLLNLDMVESQSGKIIEKLIVSEDKINASTCAFDKNNVLYSKLRPYLNKVVLPDQEGYCTTELVPLKPNEKLTREFLATLLRSNAFVSYINEKTAGAKMPRVSMGIFRQFECILPPVVLQQQFSEFYNQVDKSKFAIRRSLKILADYDII